MSAYTLLELADVQPLLSRLGLPAAVALTPIISGIENSNYFLHLPDGRERVLTLFEELTAEEAAFLGPLLRHLAVAGVPVAVPQPDENGCWLMELAGRPAQVAPRLPGRHPLQPGLAQCRAMGALLARLHLALKDYPLVRHHAHGPDWWADVAARWRPRLPPTEQGLLDDVLVRHAALSGQDLPVGLIHGDLFRDNTLFDGEHVSAVLDFSECGRDHWLLDIAITGNDFCRQWPEDAPDPKRWAAFMAGYGEVRPLLAAEEKALPVFRAVAAMRFWLSRLEVAARNREEGRGGEHVQEKDPAEMRELLRACLKS